MGVIDQLEDKIIAIKQLVAERDALAAQNAMLRAALEGLLIFETHIADGMDSRIDAARAALALPPPAAVAEAREREDGLLALVERLLAALGAWQRHMKTCSNPAEVPWVEKLATLCEAEQLTAEALALIPPAALEELRRRERSIGAEEELRAFAKDLREVPEEGIDIYERLVMTGARDQNESSFAEQGAQKMECSIRYKILSRADQIRDEREAGEK